jgi:hypothetical protein
MPVNPALGWLRQSDLETAGPCPQIKYNRARVQPIGKPLPGICEALGSTPSIRKKIKRKKRS